MTEQQVNLTLDSGAYSCWKRQEELTVEEYLEFIETYVDIIETVVNLDMIPGQWGQIPTPEQVELSAKTGLKNYKQLAGRGFDVMPVFHQGERLYWLEKMIEAGSTYIGISPGNDRTTKQKMVWLDQVFTLLCGSKGYPHVKTHGFGVTALPIMFEYPWFSVDSVSWALFGAYGSVIVPRWDPKIDFYDFTVSPYIVYISAPREGKNRNDSALGGGKHFDSMGEAEQQYVRDYVSDCNRDLEALRTDYIERQRMCCDFFVHTAEALSPRPFTPKQQGFFSNASDSEYGRTTSFGKLKKIFTVNTSSNHSDILQDKGIKDRLVSYFFIRQAKSFDLRQYVLTGRIPVKKKKKKK